MFDIFLVYMLGLSSGLITVSMLITTMVKKKSKSRDEELSNG